MNSLSTFSWRTAITTVPLVNSHCHPLPLVPRNCSPELLFTNSKSSKSKISHSGAFPVLQTYKPISGSQPHREGLARATTLAPTLAPCPAPRPPLCRQQRQGWPHRNWSCGDCRQHRPGTQQGGRWLLMVTGCYLLVKKG